MQELKDRKYDLDDLYQKYITEYELTKDGKQKIEKSRGKKKSIYLKDTGLTPNELAHRFVEKHLPINANNLEHNFINISNTENKFVDLKILDEDVLKLLCKIMMNYNDDNIHEGLLPVL